MVMSLGTISMSVSLDVAGAIGGINSLANAFEKLDGLGANAFDGFDKSVGGLKKSLSGIGDTRISVDTGKAEGSLESLGGTAKDTGSALEGMSGLSVDVNTGAALGGMQELRTAAQDVTAAVQGSGGVVFGLQTSDALAGLQQLKGGIDDTLATIRAASGQTLDVNTSAAIGSLMQLATATDTVMAQLQAADNATLAINVTRDQLDAAAKAVQELRQAVGQNMTATVSIGGLGELDAATTAAVRTREAIGGIGDEAPSINLGGLTSDLDRAVGLAGQLTSSLRGLGAIGLGAGLAGLLIAPMVQGIKTAAQLEQSLKNVEVALGNVSNADLGRLDKSIRDIGSATEYSAKEIAQVAESLAKAGYDVSDMIDGKMLPAVANLASATGSDLQTAVTGIVQAMATWSPAIVDASIAMTDASKAADILTVAANSSSADIQDIIAGMRNLGPVVSQMGVGFDEAAAAISIFTNYGLRGADAGISLARGLQNLNQPTSEAARLMDQLGITVFDTQEKFVGFQQLFGQLSNAMRDMTEQQRFTTISLLFGAEAADAYALAVSMGVDPLVATIQAMQEQGIAADQAAAKTDTLAGAWSRLQEATATALGGLAGGFVGPLTMLATMIDSVVSTFGALPSGVQQGIGAIVGFTGTLIAAVTVINLARTAMAAMNVSFLGVTGISAAISAITNFSATLAAARVAVTGFLASIGPIGWAIAAIGAVVTAGLFIWAKHNEALEKAKQAQEDYEKAVKTTDDRINTLYRSGSTKLADDMSKAVQTMRTAIADVTTTLQSAQVEWGKVMTSGDITEIAARMNQFLSEGIGQTALEWAHNDHQISDAVYYALKDGIDVATESGLVNDAKKVMDNYFKAFIPDAEDKAAVEAAMQPVLDLLQNPQIDTAKVQAKVDAIFAEYAASDTPSVTWLIEQLTALGIQLNTTAGQAEVLHTAIEQLGDSWRGMAADLRLDGDFGMAANLEALTKNFEAVSKALSTDADRQTYGSDLQVIFDAMKSGKVDVDLVLSGIAELDRQFSNGQITAEQYALGIHQMRLNIDDYAVSADKAAAANKNLLSSLTQAPSLLKATTSAFGELYRTATGKYADADPKKVLENLIPNRAETAKALEEAIAARNIPEMIRLTGILQAQNDQYDTMRGRLQILKEHFDALNTSAARPDNPHQYPAAQAQALLDTEAQRKSMAEGVTAAIEKQKQAYQGMFETFAGYQGLDSRTMAYGMSSFAGEATKVGIAMQGVQEGFSNVYRIIVQNTDAVSSLATTTLDWADKLIGAEGTWGKIDDLLAAGLIKQDEYTAAQAAYNEIAQSTADIQDYTAIIQTKQAPLIAAQTEALENQYELISRMPAQQQLVALGWMDSAESAKALEINAMAADVAAGKMGASGKAGFEEMLRSAVLLDPALGQMLDTMGLIELAADGTTILKINYDAATGAESEIAKLTESINALILALGGIPPLDVDTIGLMTAEQRVKALQGAWDMLSSDQKQTFFDKLGAGAESSSGKLQKTAEDAKRLNDALTQLGQGKKVDLDTGEFGAHLQTIADKFREIKDSGDIEKKVRIDFDDQGNLDRLKQIADQDGKTTTITTKFDQTGKDDVQNAIDNLTRMSGRVIEIKTKFTAEGETSGPDMSKYGQGGAGAAAVHLKTVLDPPEGLPDFSGVPPVKVKTEFDAPPPLNLPPPPPYVVPVQFNVATAGGVGPTNVPGGMESALGGSAGGGGITIAVAVTVTGTEQLDAIKTTIDGLANKPVSVSVSVNGAELIGALKLDVQNLSNKTVTIMVSVSGSDQISTLKTNIDGLADKTVTITGDMTLAAYAVENTNNLVVDEKVLVITGDMTLAGFAVDNTNALEVPSKTLVITGDNSAALSAYNELSNLADITKTMTINIVTNGTVPALAKGGYVPGVGPTATIARLAERGPELYRTPRGAWGLAQTEGLYPMVPGSYVYTASRTRRMLKRWDGPAYAKGGRVAMPTRASMGGTTTITNNAQEYRIAPNITVTGVTERDMDHITEQVSNAIVTAVNTTRLAKGGGAI